MPELNTIVFASRSTPFHGIGGMEIVSWDLARALAARGIRVVFLTTSIPRRPNPFHHDGVDVIPIASAPPGRYSRRWWSHSRAYYLRHLSIETSAIISVSAGGYGLVSALDDESAVVTVLQAHGTTTEEIVSKWRTRKPWQVAKSLKNLMWLLRDVQGYRRFDLVVAVGDSVYESFKRKPNAWFVDPERLRLVRNGIDHGLFAATPSKRSAFRTNLGISEDTPLVVSVSRLHRQKGLHEGMRGFAEFLRKAPTAQMIIAGSGSELAPLQNLASSLGIDAHVHFTGPLARTEVANVLAGGDVFLTTTLHSEAGTPLNILEALAAGLGVVVSSHLSMEGSIGRRVVRVDPFEADAVGAALEIAIRDSQPTSRLPDAYTIEACADGYVGLIRERMTDA